MSNASYQFKPEHTESFLKKVETRSGQKLTACYQCRRCAAGCTVGDLIEDHATPDRLIRMIVMGDSEGALHSSLVWKCVSCYTCGTRCPNQIQSAKITETLKQIAKESHYRPLKPSVAFFHESFFKSGIRWGRVNEMEFMGVYELKRAFNDIRRKDVNGVVQEIKQQSMLFLSMLKKKRMHFRFLKSQGSGELKRLYLVAQKRKLYSKRSEELKTKN
ncbi:MAG: 4Fe-4S dicluster domain-containing protein [Desulfobacterales bacterium]|nr:4Fe-4S dicluster domain-containing protein [Desulfobacterales bacterium]